MTNSVVQRWSGWAAREAATTRFMPAVPIRASGMAGWFTQSGEQSSSRSRSPPITPSWMKRRTMAVFASVDMAVTISASRAVDPAGHEGIELIADGVLEGDAVPGEQGLQAALGEGGEDVGGTTDQLATDEGLRNRSHGRSLGERGADLAAPVVGLQGGGVDVDRAVGDLAALEELADSLYP